MSAHVDLRPSRDNVTGITIGAVADRFGLAPHGLRHWEEVGLLSPTRGPDSRRRYDETTLMRVAMVQQGKQLGFALDSIRLVLDSCADPEARRAELRRHDAALELRIREAQTARRVLAGALECGKPDFLTCPEFRRTAAELIPSGSG